MSQIPRDAVVGEVSPWVDCGLRCGIGHVYRGRVRVVQCQGYDMDGDAFLQPPSADFDPDLCVVCGLKTWAQERENP